MVKTVRKQIERLYPEFFPLKSGYTTRLCYRRRKSCFISLINKGGTTESQITLPSGEQITYRSLCPKSAGCSATCTVIKESGDDPDVTNHSRIRVTVQLSLDASGCAIAVAESCHGDGTAVPSRWHKRATVMAQEDVLRNRKRRYGKSHLPSR